ncbi:sugar transferase [Zooshikella ganghwensis]|uniref:Sugar transferase n=1 Tax=Zooshikella ganghwensis TaxID=202772 RepID=A0A4P9VJ28_9GAMM|nr:sugar transferase [Zooshikella ganghwensis]RDH43213.1 sugar transferase [Zooshikella ganghwensis]
MIQQNLIRLVDIFLSIIGLSLLSPILIAITLLGFIDTGSPFFRQQRIGLNKRTFILIKFRTMKANTTSVATHLVNTKAITPLGRVLRRTKLDELPQLINVLLGQMSLIGARPCLPNQTTLIHERSIRNVYDYKPGITGLAQINSIDMSTPKKLAKVDAIMNKNINICYYFSLISQTIIGRGLGDAAHPKR